MANLSTQIVIEDVLEKNHLLQDLVSDIGNDIPTPILKAISDLDWAMRGFGIYWPTRQKLIDEGEII